MKWISLVAAILTIASTIATHAIAEVPKKISFQGYVSSLSGSPIQGTHEFAFRLYAAQNGGDPLWSDKDTLELDNGQFHAYLGANTPLPMEVFTGSVLWLETLLDGSALPSRQPLVSVAYSFRAQKADTALVALYAEAGGDSSLWQRSGNNVYRSSGNVGIGTDASEAPLTVYGNKNGSNANLMVLRNTAAGGGPMAFAIGAQGAAFPENIYGIGDETDMRLSINRVNGNVGVGTSAPVTKLHVAGGRVMGDALITNGFSLGNGSGAGELYFDHLLFNGSYGWGVADQYIQFNSGFNPSIGGQGPLAKITAWRLPEHYETGRGRLTFSARYGSNLTDVLTLEANAASINGDATISGNLCVLGQKNAVVPTSQGMTKVYCDESTEMWFADRGKAKVVAGSIEIRLDPLFLETVSIDESHPMMVQVTPLWPKPVSFSVVESTTSFTIYCDQPVTFNWKVEAKRKGYESARLELANQQE
jgi:hypothetical protein